jgi:hypothetical protein
VRSQPTHVPSDRFDHLEFARTNTADADEPGQGIELEHNVTGNVGRRVCHSLRGVAPIADKLVEILVGHFRRCVADCVIEAGEAVGVCLDAGHGGSPKDAIAQAGALLKTDCPIYKPITPVVRIGAMEQRLDAMLRAINIVQPVLQKFYGSLTDEQKERFNRLAPV